VKRAKRKAMSYDETNLSALRMYFVRSLVNIHDDDLHIASTVSCASVLLASSGRIECVKCGLLQAMISVSLPCG